jgi:hypothetical protein
MAKLLVLVGKQRKPTKYQASYKNESQRWEYAFNAACIKGSEAKVFLVKSFEDNRRNQKARDNEENINTNKTTLYPIWKRVEADNSKNGNCTKTINIGAVNEMWVRGHQ